MENIRDRFQYRQDAIFSQLKNRSFYLLPLGATFGVSGVLLVIYSIQVLASLTTTFLIATVCLELVGGFMMVAHLYLKQIAEKDKQQLLIDESRALTAIELLERLDDPSKKDSVILKIAQSFLRPDQQPTYDISSRDQSTASTEKEDEVKLQQLDEYLSVGGQQRISFNSEKCSDVRDFQEFLFWFEHAYNIVYLLENDASILMEFEDREYYGREEIYYFHEKLSRYIPQADRLFLNRVSMSSPGFWEFIGKWNIFEQLRLYLNDRHERQKDREFRNEFEKSRNDLRIEYIERQHQILRSKSQNDIDYERQRKQELIEKERLENMLLETKVVKERLEVLREQGHKPDEEEIEKLQRFLIEPLTHLRMMRNKRILGNMDMNNSRGKLANKR